MWTGFSILAVSFSFVMASRVYQSIFPRIKMVSTEFVLVPFRFLTVSECFMPLTGAQAC